MKFSHDSFDSKCYEYDKLTHAGGSALLTLIAYIMLEAYSYAGWLNNLFAACLVSFLTGIGIEVYQGFDHTADGFSWRDLVADFAGIVVAFIGVIV